MTRGGLYLRKRAAAWCLMLAMRIDVDLVRDFVRAAYPRLSPEEAAKN